MSFTGKATYSAGVNLPELAEDVSDVVGIVSPFETPLLDALGDSMRAATSTHHEWLEDTLLPNKDAINDGSILDGLTETDFDAANGDRFRAGDQIQITGSNELMLVTAVAGDTLTVIRGYAGTAAEEIATGQEINILGNAALEGGDRPEARFTNRTRCSNYTQIFTAAVEVSGSDLAASQLGLADEMDYQKQERLRELLRDLENTVINGGAPSANPQGGCADADHDVADITNPDTLRQASVFGILAAVFEALYTGLEGQTVLVEKKEQYQWKYGKAVERLTVNVDTDADGKADTIVKPMVVQLTRK